MYCPNCGNKCEENEQICPYCEYKFKQNNNSANIILAVIILFLLIISIICIGQFNQLRKSDSKLNIFSSQAEKIFNSNPDFMGLKVLIKVVNENKHFINKDSMNIAQEKLEKNLSDYKYYDSKVYKVSNNKFIIFIPNEFNVESIEKIINCKPSLELKTTSNYVDWEPTGITGANLSQANLSKYNDEWVIMLQFNKEGTKKLAEVTSEHVGKPLAIFVNGDLYSAPTIREPILGGSAMISGGADGFTQTKAQKMAELLKTDTMSFKIEEIR